MHTSKVPKIVSSLSDIQNPQSSLLKKEMKQFINDIQQQFDSVITGYQKQLQRIQTQRQSPTTRNNQRQRLNNHIDESNNEIDEIEQWMLPLNSKDFNVSTSSPFYRTPKRSWRDTMSPVTSPWGSTVRMREDSPVGRKDFALTMREVDQKTNNPNTSIAPTRHPHSHLPSTHRSRYQSRSQSKKQRQQQIVECLESEQKNLNQMTSKMMTMVGRIACNNKNQQDSNDDNNQQLMYQQFSQFNLSKQEDDQHNRSLSNICESLDNSFVSQQTRIARLKKKLIQQENQKKKQQTHIKSQKLTKQRAIKNLLSRLRQNANSVQPPQTVKGSKLLSVGHGLGLSSVANIQRQVFSLRKGSKVLINPVPVSSPLIKANIGENSRSLMENREGFLQKRPASILRQSNILTRSISGISAVSFNQ